MLNILRNLLDTNEKQVKKFLPIVAQINKSYADYINLTDTQVTEKTISWQKELRALTPEEQTVVLNAKLAEAFALVKLVTRRVQNIELHDVQLMAGIVLHQGKAAELKTGEGKTNAATLALYLNALTGRGAHLVTPNDYLARHGAGWMGPIYHKLGLTVGVIMQERAFVYDPNFESSEFHDEYAIHLKPVSRQEAYKSDITYGTNHEFGFDYLRDNMAYQLNEMVQTNPVGEWGAHNYAIVDEIDSVLIDVARTPLIISTSAGQPTERYHQASSIILSLMKDTDYEVDEKFRSATLTDLGIRRVEKMLSVSNLYEQDFEMVHLIEQALIARALYQKDRDYVVKDSQVIIVDQSTGRLLPNNRYSHGLHQAIEAKEHVEIQQESKTLAEISYQNYFRMYRKLAGMSGTVITESEEFFKIYKLEAVAIPTHQPVKRRDFNDVVYKTEAGKFKAVADEIEKCYKQGQPVLVGTTSVEKSQILHDLLSRKKIAHEILNAKNHEREALIIAQAGRKGSVTVSTNMAGRGVDIVLGGDPFDKEKYVEICALNGLHVIGTERHESRRIDNQLRGRSGRQGDPGSSRFFISLQDDLMRIFGGDQVKGLMDRFGLDENIPLEAGLVSRAIENAQKKVEGFNFDRRKYVVEMDDVINIHRDVIYKLRRRMLEFKEGNEVHKEWFIEKVGITNDLWEKNAKRFGNTTWLRVVGELSLPVVDLLWMEHLIEMDQIREGIGLRGYAQKDPVVEYKREGHSRFELLISKMYSLINERLVHAEHLQIVSSKETPPTHGVTYHQGEFESGVGQEKMELESQNKSRHVEKVSSGDSKVGRNDLCPCGSGKKFKKCHGK